MRIWLFTSCRTAMLRFPVSRKSLRFKNLSLTDCTARDKQLSSKQILTY